MSRLNDKQSNISEIVKSTAVTTATAVGTVGAVKGAIAFFGFSSSGVVGGSLAAAIQSTFGGVIAKGSGFAIAQSVGATGLGTAAAPIAAVGGVGGYLCYHYSRSTYNWIRNQFNGDKTKIE